MKILHGIWIAMLTFAACHPRQSANQTSAPPAEDSSLSWSVRGCAAAALNPETRFPEKGQIREFPDLPGPGVNDIRAEGDSVVYERFVQHGCCRKVRVSVQRNGNQIIFTEYWWGQVCKCMCQSSLRAVSRQVPRGVYQVYAIETGTDPITDKPSDGRDTVMTRVAEIR